MKKLLFTIAICASCFKTHTALKQVTRLVTPARHALVTYQSKPSTVSKIYRNPVTDFVKEMISLRATQEAFIESARNLRVAVEEAANAYRQQRLLSNARIEELKGFKAANDTVQKCGRWATNAFAGIIGFLTVKNAFQEKN
ncbi:MAG: hypothetical protein LVQ75_03140 [Candidatus Babeliales bacterium]|jgi:ABC-type proline/glycine betaine transport system ATPase subunit